MRQQSTKPLRVWYHVGVEGADESPDGSRERLCVAETMVQVTSFEVVDFAFDPGSVEEISIGLCKVMHGRCKLVRVGIVRYNHTKMIRRILNGTSSFCGMLDCFDIFTGASDYDIYMGQVLSTSEPQMWNFGFAGDGQATQ